MDFRFKQNITEELILSQINEESIMGFYLKIPVKKGLFRSVLRQDKNPTCSFFRNKSGRLIYKDFATQDYLDCFNIVMRLFGCDYYKALKIIANDFNIVKDDTLIKNKGKIDKNPIKIEEKEFSKIQVEIQEFTDLELKWWNKYGITKEILKKYNVFSCKHVFLNDQLFAKSQQHCPIFGYYGGMIKENGFKHELWRCYFPKRTSFRFIGNWPTKKIQGYNQLPKNGKVLVITKSLKDVMCLNSLGIPACAPNSETQFINDSVLVELKQKFKRIIVMFDNDQTGITFMNKLKKKYPKLIYTWLPRDSGAKDISDYRSIYGYEKTINLIKDYIIKYLK